MKLICLSATLTHGWEIIWCFVASAVCQEWQYTTRVLRRWYVIGTDEQQLHKISHWTDKCTVSQNKTINLSADLLYVSTCRVSVFGLCHSVCLSVYGCGISLACMCITCVCVQFLSSDVITKPPSSSHGHCRAGSLSLCPPSLSRCTSSNHEDISSSVMTATLSTSDVSVASYSTVSRPRSLATSSGVIMSASELLTDGRSSAMTSSVTSSVTSDTVRNIVASVRPGAIDNSLLVTHHSRVMSSPPLPPPASLVLASSSSSSSVVVVASLVRRGRHPPTTAVRPARRRAADHQNTSRQHSETRCTGCW